MPIYHKGHLERFYENIGPSTWSVRLGRGDRSMRISYRSAVAIQSMTTTRAADVEATVEELSRLWQLGAPIVRVTAPTLEDARAFGEIVRLLEQGICSEIAGVKVPRRILVADIHFSPEAALEAAKYVDAVRINPGNYLPNHTPHSEAEAAALQAQMRKRLGDLVAVCKEHRVVVRIGVNHGSLAPRIVEKYGAGIDGMVASAMEFLEVCRELDFERQVVVSLKASDVRTMVFANRAFRFRSLLEGGYYNPLHLGVTEAGGGIDARIKSAIGIGSLLAEGIGNTIRVSLTEDPANEINFANVILKQVATHRPYKVTTRRKIIRRDHLTPPTICERTVPAHLHAFRKGLILAFLPEKERISSQLLLRYGFTLSEAGTWQHTVASVDGLLCSADTDLGALPVELHPYFLQPRNGTNYYALDDSWFVSIVEFSLFESGIIRLNLPEDPQQVLILKDVVPGIARHRYMGDVLYSRPVSQSIVFWHANHEQFSGEELQAAMGIEYGAVLLDDLGNGIVASGAEPTEALRNAQSILQALGLRRVRTEFVACPGCGRTLFDLQETFEKVQAALGHLAHLKIAIMGCIVNGPGEMGDADYGYVGSAPDRITLYKRGEIVRRNIPTKDALEALIALIRSEGDWHD